MMKDEEEILRELGFEPLEDARKLGMVVDGWGILDYLNNAIENNGYEMVLIWGNQGSGKSSFMLTIAYKILRNWEEVLNALCFTPMDVIKKAEELPFGKRYSILLWDDVGVHFPATSFRTNIDIYEAVGKMLDAYRTISSVIICTAPDIRRFPKVMRDNETIEIWMTRLPTKENISYYRALRIVKLQNYYSDVEIYLKKPTIEHGFYHLQEHIPRDIWNKYWQKRLELGRKAVEMLKEKINPHIEKNVEKEDEETATILKCPNGHIWIPRRKHANGEKVKCPKCGKYFRIGIE